MDRGSRAGHGGGMTTPARTTAVGAYGALRRYILPWAHRHGPHGIAGCTDTFSASFAVPATIYGAG